MKEKLLKYVAKTKFWAVKNSPELLLAGGVIGVVASTVMISRASAKVHYTLMDHTSNIESVKSMNDVEPVVGESHLGAAMARVYADTALEMVKLYGPGVVLGVASLGAIFSSHNILKKRNIALMAAYATLDEGFKTYRGRVVDKYGEKIDRQFMYGTESKKLKEFTTDENGKVTSKTKDMEVVPEGSENVGIYSRCFDEFNPRYSKSPQHNLMFLKHIESYVNDSLRINGHVFLNEVYDQLGFARTSAGAVVGWLLSGDGDNYITFNYIGDEAFMNGHESAVWLDFNVDGVIYDKI